MADKTEVAQGTVLKDRKKLLSDLNDEFILMKQSKPVNWKKAEPIKSDKGWGSAEDWKKLRKAVGGMKAEGSWASSVEQDAALAKAKEIQMEDEARRNKAYKEAMEWTKEERLGKRLEQDIRKSNLDIIFKGMEAEESKKKRLDASDEKVKELRDKLADIQNRVYFAVAGSDPKTSVKELEKLKKESDEKLRKYQMDYQEAMYKYKRGFEQMPKTLQFDDKVKKAVGKKTPALQAWSKKWNTLVKKRRSYNKKPKGKVRRPGKKGWHGETIRHSKAASQGRRWTK